MSGSDGARAFKASVLLRGLAIAIAVAGLADPAITMSGVAHARLAVVRQDPSSVEAERVRQRLARSLGSSYDVVPDITRDTAAAIVIGSGYPDEPLRGDLPVATVTVPHDAPPAIRIVRAQLPAEVPAGTAMHIGVELEGIGVSGRTADVIVRVAGLEMGRASHRWATDRERWHADLDAVPVGDPPFVVRVEASGSNSADAVTASVNMRRSPFLVEVYEPRPSWATTFVRRALEADARFHVAGLSFSSRGISATTRDDVPLNDPDLDRFDVVIAGGLDRLSSADVRSLDRYMRRRGGAVVLVPAMRVETGAVRNLLPGGFGRAAPQTDVLERLLERPVTLATRGSVASLEVSELLVWRALPPGSDAIASTPGRDGSPVVVSMPHGEGRLLLSGAMDAWRFRAADNQAFDRFWQSTIAGLALAAPPPIELRVVPALLHPLERGEVIVRVRSREAVPVSATIDGDQPIRLSPAAEAGVFTGRFVAGGTAGRSTVRVEAGGAQPRSLSQIVLVQSDARAVEAVAAAPLSMLAASHRGVDVTPDHLADAERFVRNTVVSPPATVVRHPMRSAWWIVPFAACLSAEWWLRRRRGQR
jgi:hypothetical protein